MSQSRPTFLLFLTKKHHCLSYHQNGGWNRDEVVFVIGNLNLWRPQVNVGINGLVHPYACRIGRIVLRNALEMKDFNVVAVNEYASLP
ncbi:hypothetical protein CC1G_15303 [Coprinopsis cinerea okayama7|uniref:Uncharacterized protein n=1 Tax=Coprinopsis cinerea (strain Okayama-7 / 130 / ATCC MYA-4618 / FGSC 9003) TaxID=240176 RepID=D6RPY2_COPC7|nr:hypothetical protein CC1G_15303 [Coprinopsis cinerea okayama7\|eukprot:XP_002910396.1 hypothetical protein CC1G_15303 [Coprinopsis cinerea okayama7\